MRLAIVTTSTYATCQILPELPSAALDALTNLVMDKLVKFGKPVFGAGAPKTNETSVGITSPTRGTRGAPAALRIVLRVTRPFHVIERRAPASPLACLWARKLVLLRHEHRAYGLFPEAELVELLRVAQAFGAHRELPRRLEGDGKLFGRALKRHVRGPVLDRLTAIAARLPANEVSPRLQRSIRAVERAGCAPRCSPRAAWTLRLRSSTASRSREA